MSNKDLVRREEYAIEAREVDGYALTEVRELRIAISETRQAVSRLTQIIEAQALAISRLTEEVGQFRQDYRDATFDSVDGTMPDTYRHLDDAEYAPPIGDPLQDVHRGARQSVDDMKRCAVCKKARGDTFCVSCNSYICNGCYRDDCSEKQKHDPRDHLAGG